eukprot:SAG22_NODE_385_length_11304_cov_21.304775_4_plen_81_part_00
MVTVLPEPVKVAGHLHPVPSRRAGGSPVQPQATDLLERLTRTRLQVGAEQPCARAAARESLPVAEAAEGAGEGLAIPAVV